MRAAISYSDLALLSVSVAAVQRKFDRGGGIQ